MVMPPIGHYRAGLEKALQYDTDGTTFEKVVERVSAGHAQYWPITNRSVMVTQISGKTLHFWLAAGNIAELQAVTPHILEFGREQGCTRATLTGRRGWLRSFLVGTGWKQSKIIQMEVEL